MLNWWVLVTVKSLAVSYTSGKIQYIFVSFRFCKGLNLEDIDSLRILAKTFYRRRLFF